MHNPTRKRGYALIALGAGALLFWLALSERLGPEESAPTMGAGMIGLTLLLASAYFVPATLLAAQGRARLLAGTDVVARWPVGAADWERYCASIPKWSRFTPPRRRSAGDVEIIAGKRSVLIDDYYLRLDPGKGVGMLEAEWAARANPACIVITIGAISRVASTGSYNTRRSRLLLPVPASAMGEGDRALRHYQRAIAGVRDLGDLARQSPVLAWRIFGGLLAASVIAAAAGVWLHLSGTTGNVPAGLAIGGLLTAVGVLVVGWAQLPRRTKTGSGTRSGQEALIADAERGDADAQLRLALHHHANQDAVQAALWFRKAADQGNAVAQYNVGALYTAENGHRNDARAAQWYRKAADQGLAAAQSELALFHVNGWGVPKDTVAGYALLSCAAAAVPEAPNRDVVLKNRETLSGYMSAQQIGAAEALAAEMKADRVLAALDHHLAQRAAGP